MPITPVSAENDITGGPGLHLLLLCYLPDLWESMAPMNWYPGTFAARHVLTKNVSFNKQRIVLEGHDLGPCLTHAPQADVWRALKSSRKTVYSAAAVKANETPLACVDENRRMMTCGDPFSLPSGFNFTNPSHNLFIGMSELDELKGDVAIACSLVTDFIMFIVSPPAHPVEAATRLTTPEGLTSGFFGVNPTKMGVRAAVGFIGSLIVSDASGGREPVKVKLSQGNGWVEHQLEVSYTPQTGVWEGKHKSNKVGCDVSETKVSSKPKAPQGNPEPNMRWGEKL